MGLLPAKGLPDPGESRAVLIGVSAYAALAPLPAVAKGLEDVEDRLADPALWGIPRGRVVRLGDGAADRHAVLAAVHDAAERAREALVVYFSGHGLLFGPDAQLHLAMPDSTMDRPFVSVRYADLAQILRDYCTARLKVVILDCCFSGQAVATMGGGAGPAERTAIDGVCVITACADTEFAYSLPGEPYTAFTGELVSVLRCGVADGPPLLTPRHLWTEITRRFQARGVDQRPQLHGRNAGESVALVRNQAPRALGAGHDAPASAGVPDPDRVDHRAFTDAMASAESLGLVVTSAAREARAALAADAVLVVQRKPGGDVWRVASEDPPRQPARDGREDDELFSRWERCGSSLPGGDRRSAWTYDADDGTCGADRMRMLTSRGLYRAAAAPIRTNDEVWGELLAARTAAGPRFSRRTAEAVADLACILAMAVMRARNAKRLEQAGAANDGEKQASARRQEEYELIRDLWTALGPPEPPGPPGPDTGRDGDDRASHGPATPA